MYSDIADIYDEIFPVNQGFLEFVTEYLPELGARVLDLACGTGGYVDALSATHEVTGIDLSDGMINAAKRHSMGIFHKMSFTDIDKIDETYDCIYCIGNSISYLENRLRPDFFSAVSAMLDQGGRFILQTVNWDKFMQTGTIDLPVKTISDGRTFHRRYEQQDDGSTLFCTELQKDATIEHDWSDPLYPARMQELSEMIEVLGMRVCNTFGDYKKSPFIAENSPAIILVAQKT